MRTLCQVRRGDAAAGMRMAEAHRRGGCGGRRGRGATGRGEKAPQASQIWSGDYSGTGCIQPAGLAQKRVRSRPHSRSKARAARPHMRACVRMAPCIPERGIAGRRAAGLAQRQRRRLQPTPLRSSPTPSAGALTICGQA